ncbi:MAG: hypothetical protein M3462_01165 [Chloroflexota bacterium]|nr:hypothetical protein [Chloroflexota bacterium]
MRTLWTCSLVLLMILGWATSSGSAQNDDDDPLADLQTVVAEQGEEIDRLGNRVATLEAGDAPSSEGRPTEDAGSGDEGDTGDTGVPVDGHDPVALGDPAVVGEWTISVVGYRPDATGLVLAEGNPPPGDGQRYVLIKLDATYDGEGEASFFFSSSWGVGDDTTILYDEFSDGCPFVPDGFSGRDDTRAGDSIEGNICFLIDTDDVEGLVLYIRPFTSSDDDVVAFALTEDQ